MKMLNSDHQPHISGTPMPHGKPQIQIGCGGDMRDQGDTTRNQFVLSVYVKSALLDSIYQSIPKVFAGQPFFITYSTQSLNQTRLVQQPITDVQPLVGAVSPSRTCANRANPGNQARHLKHRPGNPSIIARNALWASDTASHPARYRQDVRPYPSATGNDPFPSTSEFGRWLHLAGKTQRT